MRSADPAAYDQFKLLASGTTFNEGFRALMFTHTATTTITITVGQNIGGTVTTKTMTVNVQAYGTVVLPLSGETISYTGTGTVYALI